MSAKGSLVVALGYGKSNMKVHLIFTPVKQLISGTVNRINANI